MDRLIYRLHLQPTLAQQRSHSLRWDDQSVSESEFRVHSFEVFSGANVLSAIVTIVSQEPTQSVSTRDLTKYDYRIISPLKTWAAGCATSRSQPPTPTPRTRGYTSPRPQPKRAAAHPRRPPSMSRIRSPEPGTSSSQPTPASVVMPASRATATPSRAPPLAQTTPSPSPPPAASAAARSGARAPPPRRSAPVLAGRSRVGLARRGRR